MTESSALVIFLVALAVMIAIGALLPVLLPGLIRLLDRTVLKEERHD